VLNLEGARTSIGNSPQILAFLSGYYPESKLLNGTNGEMKKKMIELCNEFDQMGTAIQASMYGRLLGAPGFKTKRDLTLKFWGDDPNFAYLTPLWQRIVLRTCFPLFRLFILFAFKLRSNRTLEKTDKIIFEKFEKVSAMLSDGRKYLLGGDYPTIADITFCALAGPLLLVPQYGGFIHEKSLYEIAQSHPDVLQFVDLHRNTPAGQWVLSMYDKNRPLREGLRNNKL